MIDSKKIMEISQLSHLRPWQQEKHYLQSLILTIISDYPLVFKGGTYLWFFHGLNRFSEDLDFTAKGLFKRELPEFVSRSLRLYGYENKLKIINENNFNVSARFMIDGPLHTNEKDRCIVYVEISMREKVILPGIPLSINLPQYDIPVRTITGMNLDEVGAEKVRAILTRNKDRDVYDLFYLIRLKNILFDQELINRKLDYYNKKFDPAEFLNRLGQAQKTYKKELRQTVLGELPDFDVVRAYIENWVKGG